MRFSRRSTWATFLASCVFLAILGVKCYRDGLPSLFDLRRPTLAGGPLALGGLIALVLGTGSLLVLLFGRPVARRTPKVGPRIDPEDGRHAGTENGPFDPWA